MSEQYWFACRPVLVHIPPLHKAHATYLAQPPQQSLPQVSEAWAESVAVWQYTDIIIPLRSFPIK